ncbi:MAG: diaminopimelate decarboxylase [Thermodesulfobacteriota bacterium]
MHHFNYKNKELFCEEVAVQDIAAAVSTPFYLYSTATLSRHFRAFDEAFSVEYPQGGPLDHLTCFSAKSCSNLAILNLFAGLGGGVDIVSGGELYRCLKAEVDPRKIVYSGVGKTEDEMRFALESGILMFNVESRQELETLQNVAARISAKAPVSLRINPDVDPKTHPYISTGLARNKFGIPVNEALEVYKIAAGMANIEIKGVSCHIGSQLTEVSPFVESLQKVKVFMKQLEAEGIHFYYLDIGGGLGIRYDTEDPPLPAVYAEAISREMAGLKCVLILEPGRVIVGNAGILVTRVLYTKGSNKNFIIVDAGMNDLARPSLYNAYHAIQAVEDKDRETKVADVVGPICETGDFLAKDQEIPAFERGDLLAFMSCGAYGFTMSSNYNSRPRVPEILVANDNYYVIRERESYKNLIAGETIPEINL